MSDDAFANMIATVAACVDEVERFRQHSLRDDSRFYAHHVRLQKLYLDVCALAAEHGSPQGQRVLEQIGKLLAQQAKPHGEPE